VPARRRPRLRGVGTDRDGEETGELEEAVSRTAATKRSRSKERQRGELDEVVGRCGARPRECHQPPKRGRCYTTPSPVTAGAAEAARAEKVGGIGVSVRSQEWCRRAAHEELEPWRERLSRCFYRYDFDSTVVIHAKASKDRKPPDRVVPTHFSCSARTCTAGRSRCPGTGTTRAGLGTGTAPAVPH